jgi:hypothetical protein
MIKLYKISMSELTLAIRIEVVRKIIDDYKTMLEFGVIDELPEYIKDMQIIG